MKNKCILIGIAGGTGSGKTLVARNIFNEIGSTQVVIIEQDWYYKDLSEVPVNIRNKTNFDHPDSIDTELLISHIEILVRGEAIESPSYDFNTHTRAMETKEVSGHKVIILEGIFTLISERLRNLMNMKVFVDTDSDIRFIRRLKRDILERGRNVETVIEQYETTVRPMHLQFVEPTKRFADIIIPDGGGNQVAIDLIKTKILTLLAN